MRQRLGSRLLVIFLALAIVPLFAAGWLTGNHAQEALRKSAENTLMEVAKITTGHIEQVELGSGELSFPSTYFNSVFRVFYCCGDGLLE